MWWTIQFRIDSAFKTRHTISRNMLDMILIITCLEGPNYNVSCGDPRRVYGSGHVFSRFVSVFDCSQFSPLYLYIL